MTQDIAITSANLTIYGSTAGTLNVTSASNNLGAGGAVITFSNGCTYRNAAPGNYLIGGNINVNGGTLSLFQGVYMDGTGSTAGTLTLNSGLITNAGGYGYLDCNLYPYGVVVVNGGLLKLDTYLSAGITLSQSGTGLWMTGGTTALANIAPASGAMCAWSLTGSATVFTLFGQRIMPYAANTDPGSNNVANGTTYTTNTVSQTGSYGSNCTATAGTVGSGAVFINSSGTQTGSQVFVPSVSYVGTFNGVPGTLTGAFNGGNAFAIAGSAVLVGTPIVSMSSATTGGLGLAGSANAALLTITSSTAASGILVGGTQPTAGNLASGYSLTWGTAGLIQGNAVYLSSGSPPAVGGVTSNQGSFTLTGTGTTSVVYTPATTGFQVGNLGISGASASYVASGVTLGPSGTDSGTYAGGATPGSPNGFNYIGGTSGTTIALTRGLVASGSNYMLLGNPSSGTLTPGMTVSVGTATLSGGALTAITLTGGTPQLTYTGTTAYGILYSQSGSLSLAGSNVSYLAITSGTTATFQIGNNPSQTPSYPVFPQAQRPTYHIDPDILRTTDAMDTAYRKGYHEGFQDMKRQALEIVEKVKRQFPEKEEQKR